MSNRAVRIVAAVLVFGVFPSALVLTAFVSTSAQTAKTPSKTTVNAGVWSKLATNGKVCAATQQGESAGTVQIVGGGLYAYFTQANEVVIDVTSCANQQYELAVSVTPLQAVTAERVADAPVRVYEFINPNPSRVMVRVGSAATSSGDFSKPIEFILPAHGSLAVRLTGNLLSWNAFARSSVGSYTQSFAGGDLN